MKTYDWVVIGAGLTGAAISYELAKKGLSVLVLEQDITPQSATRYSYGGIPYWSGTTPLTKQLCIEGIERQRILSQELDADTQFREIDLLLTIAANEYSEKVAANFSHCYIPPRLLSVDEACEIEPLLNGNAIAGAVTVRHAHVNPQAIVQAYLQAFFRLGGNLEIAQVQKIVKEKSRVSGVTTATNETYHADNILVCAGGFSRALLKTFGVPCRLYFNHAEMIEISPVDLRLRTLVMPAEMGRFQLENEATTAELDSLWDEPNNEPVPPILEAGAIQFIDGSLRIGQISRFLTNLNAKIDAAASEADIRAKVEKILPGLGNLPGSWHHCLVGFSHDLLPLIGEFSDLAGLHVFSGFSSPFVFVPSVSQRFANFIAGKEDEIISQLSPLRFSVK